jgi:uncharacterized membrane protein YphA (DoxX/SURF4 family)
MSLLVLIGRVLFVGVFVTSAIAHFRATDMMAGYAKSKGVPQARLAVLAGGVLLGLGSISVLLGIWADLGGLLLAIFLLPTAFLIHAFWKEPAEQKMAESIHFYKDLGLAGASLMLTGLVVIAGDKLGFTITGPLFG